MKTALILFFLIAGFISMQPKTVPCDAQIHQEVFLKGKRLFELYSDCYRQYDGGIEKASYNGKIYSYDSISYTIGSPNKFNYSLLQNWK